MVAAAARAGASGEAATATSGIGSAAPATGASAAGGAIAAGEELVLANWCSVQRIARRSGVLSEERVKQLEAIGFDFDGADALS